MSQPNHGGLDCNIKQRAYLCAYDIHEMISRVSYEKLALFYVISNLRWYRTNFRLKAFESFEYKFIIASFLLNC